MQSTKIAKNCKLHFAKIGKNCRVEAAADKQIVYETYDLGDYSELLEAKVNYEKLRGK